MNEVQTTAQTAPDSNGSGQKFKGYTLEELRYQRALVALQKEFCKSKLTRNVHNIQKSKLLNPSSSTSSLPGKVGFVASKIFTGLNYLDYAMIGFSVFGAVRKIFSIFRRNKKK